MNILISVGCNGYDNLTPLNGAERDGEAIFERLTGPSAMYDSTRSRILRSPKIQELRECFKQVFSQSPQVDVFTFFFAGHSGVNKGGSFYLFLRDSDSEIPSATAFPIVELFGIINERVPKQVNIVIDACQSGGSSFDLHHLIKPDLVGSADSTRVTFLAACTAWELASETDNGGNLTAEILKCLDGEHQIQTKRAFLDLVEVASHTSRIVTQSNPKQRPITWALNLHGYLQSLNPNIPTNDLWRPANPMSLLTVLLLSGHALGLSSSWTLRDLDRTSAGFYIPSDYLHFSEPIMQDGTNFIRRVGYDFWTARQFSQLFLLILDRELKVHARSHHGETLALIALASIIFPNRLPLCLER